MASEVNQTGRQNVEIGKVKLLENFESLEVLVAGDEGGVLVFSAEVFEV